MNSAWEAKNEEKYIPYFLLHFPICPFCFCLWCFSSPLQVVSSCFWVDLKSRFLTSSHWLGFLFLAYSRSFFSVHLMHFSMSKCSRGSFLDRKTKNGEDSFKRKLILWFVSTSFFPFLHLEDGISHSLNPDWPHTLSTRPPSSTQHFISYSPNIFIKEKTHLTSSSFWLLSFFIYLPL